MQFRSSLFIVFASALVLLGTFKAHAQGAGAAARPSPQDEQNDSFRDNLKRMEIKREEKEHQKLLEQATQIKETAEALTKEVDNNHLAHEAEKKLKEIEKSAKHIRSESGGSDDNKPLDPAPATLEEALKRLNEASERLHSGMEKTSRHVVSATVVATTTEIIQLIKVIRGYLN